MSRARLGRRDSAQADLRVVAIMAILAVALLACASNSEPTGVKGRPIVTAVADPSELTPALGNYRFKPGSLDGEIGPPQFRQISSRGRSTCGVRIDGALACNGKPIFDSARPRAPTAVLPGEFLEIASGGNFACGLLADGTLRCGGFNGYRQSEPPAGAFRRIVAGGGHACALSAAGAVVCWGRNDDGQSDAPGGIYTDIAAGDFHTCALTPASFAVCWGYGERGQLDAPADQYIGITAGYSHTCGLTNDHTLDCWGTMENLDDYIPSADEPPDLERLYR